MLGKVEKKPRGRTDLKQPVHARIVSAVKNATVLTVTFNQPIVHKETPAYTTDVAGANALSATSPSLNVVEITFSASIATATEVNIPVAEPGIRTKRGGFVADTTFPVT
jgi:hypothetical protein